VDNSLNSVGLRHNWMASSNIVSFKVP